MVLNVTKNPFLSGKIIAKRTKKRSSVRFKYDNMTYL